MNYTFKEERRSGNTTRQIDAYIQELFDTGKITVIDHAWMRDNNLPFNLNRRLSQKIIDRLKLEHKGLFINDMIVRSNQKTNNLPVIEIRQEKIRYKPTDENSFDGKNTFAFTDGKLQVEVGSDEEKLLSNHPLCKRK